MIALRFENKPTHKQAIHSTVIQYICHTDIHVHVHWNACLKHNMQMHFHVSCHLLNLMSCFCVGRQALADAAHFRDSAATPKQLDECRWVTCDKLVVDVYPS